MYGEVSLRSVILFLVLIALSFLLPAFLPVYYLYLGNELMMYAILAIGLDLLLGWSGQFAFAHIAFFGVGIYGTALLRDRLGIPFVVGVPLAALFAGVIGFLIGVPATRLRAVYLALATYAFAECAQWVYRSWDSLTNGSDGLRIKPPNVLGYVTGSDGRAFPIVTIILSLTLLAVMYLTKSKIGRNLCAIRDSEHVAAASGIDVQATKVIAFTLSAVFAGIAGGTYTLFETFINSDVLGITQLVLVLTMIVVGGTGSLVGVLIGVVVIGLLPEVLRAAPSDLLVWQEFVYGLILVLAIMFMPRGLWGMLQQFESRWMASSKTIQASVLERNGEKP
jgi:branched-chain amino acid transport system permease protein